MARQFVWLSLAIVLAAMATLPLVGYAEYGDYKSFLLNSVRDAMVSGSLSFTVANNGGSIAVNGNSITVQKGWVIVLENIADNTSSKFKIWIGSDGWTDIDDLDVERLVIKNENGDTLYEFTNAVVSISRTYANIPSIYSTLTIYVPATSSGWTQFIFNGIQLINGNSGDEIKVVGVRPWATVSLNIDGTQSQRIYAEGAAETAYVNAAEVPEIGLFPIFTVALFALVAVVAGRARLMVKNIGKSAG